LRRGGASRWICAPRGVARKPFALCKPFSHGDVHLAGSVPRRSSPTALGDSVVIG
jgi:hypothetical protein